MGKAKPYHGLTTRAKKGFLTARGVQAHKCKRCEKIIRSQNKSGFCGMCYDLNRKGNRYKDKDYQKNKNMINPKQIETIEFDGVVKTSAKTYDGFLHGKINHFLRFPYAKYSGKEIELLIRGFLSAYKTFHPTLKATIPLEKFKGKSGIKVSPYPNYFETIQYRKTDNGIKEIKHKIPKWQLKQIINAINPLRIKEKYKTRYIAQEYLKCAEIEKNSKGRRFFDEKGFNFSMFSGSRDIYIPFNTMLLILQYYGFLKYYKNGEIERLKSFNNFEIQGEFTI